MQLRSHSWITRAAAAVVLPALFAGGALGATLSGNIVHDGSGHGLYYVYVMRLNLTSPIVGWTILTAPGPWSVSGVPNGHFFIVAWRDVNGNFIPSRGEPMGFYGVPFPSRVTVSNNQSRSGLDIVMGDTNLGAELRGQITYSGTRHGRIWVAPHTSADFGLDTVIGTPWTMTSLGEYQSYVLDHGTYYVTAFMDVNGNMVRDPGEPSGASGAVNVVVTPGVSYTVDVHLQEFVTAVEPRTWGGVKSLYRD